MSVLSRLCESVDVCRNSSTDKVCTRSGVRHCIPWWSWTGSCAYTIRSWFEVERRLDHGFLCGRMPTVSGYSLPGQTQWSWCRCWNFESCHKETSEKGVFISERRLWIYEERCIWICKGKDFNGYPDTSSEQENVNLIISFFQYSADKHIRSVSSAPWITPETRRKIRRRNKIHAKAKKTVSKKLGSKFETLRRDDVRKQHDLYVNNLVGDIKANPRDFYLYINSGRKKDNQGFPTLKRRGGTGIAYSEIEQAEEFNGRFTDVFNKNEHSEIPFPSRSAPFMDDSVVSKEVVTKPS